MKKSLVFAAIVIGLSAIITQIIVLREAISGFYGNELVLGVVFGNWLLITGLGAYLGRYIKDHKNKFGLFILTQIMIAIFAVLMVFLIRSIRGFITIPGELIGLTPIMFYSFLILLPFCLLSGFQITLAAAIFSKAPKEKTYQVNSVYILEGLGNMLGGLVFSYFLIFILNSFQAICLVVFLNLFSAFLLSNLIKKKGVKNLVSVLAIFFILFFSYVDLNLISTTLQYPGQEIVEQKNSIYGSVVVTKTKDQLNFYEDGFPLFSTQNAFANEETVHYAMSQHPNPKTVLLISGGISGTLKEVLKYDIERVDYVELDPELIELGKEYTDSLSNNKIRTYNLDGRYFVKNTKNKYDVVIIDLPDPVSIQINRFYTIEFFKEIKRTTNKGGVLSLSLTGGENYLRKEQKELNSVIYNTLNKEFKNVIIIPGDKNYFIASDSGLEYNIKNRLIEKGVETEYIQYYADGKITEDRINFINNAIEKDSKINNDFKPLSHFLYLKYWLSIFKLKVYYIIIFLVIILIAVLYSVKVKPVPLSILITGFTGSSVLLLLFIAFQIMYGFVYFKISIIITSFMIGLLAGSFLINKWLRKRKINKKLLAVFDLITFIYLVVVPFIILNINKSDNLIAIEIIFPFLTIIIGALVGIKLPIAMKLHEERHAVKNMAMLYSVDLAGACLGAYLTSILLLPLLGLVNVSLVLGSLNLLSALYLTYS